MGGRSWSPVAVGSDGGGTLNWSPEAEGTEENGRSGADMARECWGGGSERDIGLAGVGAKEEGRAAAAEAAAAEV